MVRLYDQQAKFLTLLLFYMRDAQGVEPYDVVRYFIERSNRHAKGDGAFYKRLAEDLGNSRKDLDATELITTLLKQAYDKPDTHDGDLVETIVDFLQLEHVRNRMDSEMLQQLRKAILLPEELRSVKEKLATKELRCSCGHRYHDGELTTLSLSRDGVFISCARCRLPSLVVCFKKDGCDNLSRIDNRDLARITRSICHDHKEAKDAAATDPTVVQESVNSSLRSFQQFALGANEVQPRARGARQVAVPTPSVDNRVRTILERMRELDGGARFVGVGSPAQPIAPPARTVNPFTEEADEAFAPDPAEGDDDQ